jgi:hypothetical protein
VFPSGRAFSHLRVWGADGRLATSAGAVIADGVVTPVGPAETPDLDDAFGNPAGGTISFPGLSPIEVEVVHGVSIGLGEPNDFFFGHDRALNRKVMTDCPARMTWDGEVATGWLERSRSF